MASLKLMYTNNILKTKHEKRIIKNIVILKESDLLSESICSSI